MSPQQAYNVLLYGHGSNLTGVTFECVRVLEERVVELERQLADSPTARSLTRRQAHEALLARISVEIRAEKTDAEAKALRKDKERLDWLALQAGATHGDTEDEWRISWKTRSLYVWLRDGKADVLRAAIDAAQVGK